MLSGKVFGIGKGRVWAVVALLLVQGMFAGCLKRADVIERAAPSSNQSPGFLVVRQEGKWWLISPARERFFSMGVCVVSRGSSKEEFDAENPSYAAWQHYADSQQWAAATLARLNSWGFTTAGGWSDYQELRSAKERQLFITPVLHMGSTSGLPWWDMWDEKNVARMEEVAREKILAIRDDPRLMGYYSDNELGWWNAALWKGTMEQSSSSGQRRRLVAMLRDDYGGSWQKLMGDFG